MENFNVSAKAQECAEYIQKTFKKGATCNIVALTKVRMYGGKKNPLLNRTYKLTEYHDAVIGVAYKAKVDGASKTVGNGQECTLKDSKYAYYNDFVEVDKKTLTNMYLKVQYKKNSTAYKSYHGYYVDGREATEEEIAYIEANLIKATHKPSSTQREVGLTEETQVIYEAPILANILTITQGAQVYSPKMAMVEETVLVEA